jgi:hypothetical protein
MTGKRPANGPCATSLADGPVDVQTVKRLASAAGIGWRTIETAKARLEIVSHRVGGAGADGRWTWELPNPATLTPQTPLLRPCGLSESPHETRENEGAEPLTPQAESNGGLSDSRKLTATERAELSNAVNRARIEKEDAERDAALTLIREEPDIGTAPLADLHEWADGP